MDSETAGLAGVDGRRERYELWQEMAGRWERGRHVLWRASEPVSQRLVAALSPRPGATILDLAAGVGETGFLIAERLGAQGRLICSDFAPAMVEAARRVAAERRVQNADFRVLDAEHLDLPDASVDGVVCRFGYMLMGDPARALRETRRVLRPGGRLAAAVFGEPERNPWMTVARRVMVEAGHLAAPAPSEPGLFSMGDPERIGAMVTQAGFARCEVEAMEIAFAFDGAESLWAYTSELQGPIALAIAALDEEERRAVRTAIEEGYAGFRDGDGGYRIPGLALTVLAG